MRLFLSGGVGALIMTLGGVTVGAQPGSHPRLMIRIYNGEAAVAADVRAARAAADKILEAAGVLATWRECRKAADSSAGPIDACGEPLTAREVVVRLVSAPDAPRRETTVFGDSLVDAQTRTGTLATVYADRVARAAARLRIDPGTLLGRAIAHEIGHLLLGTNEHSDDGLMRAYWPDRRLLAGGTRPWRFSRREASQLAPAVLARSAPPAAVGTAAVAQRDTVMGLPVAMR